MSEAIDKARTAKETSYSVALASSNLRSQAIRSAAQCVLNNTDEILSANRCDVACAKASGMAAPLLDRLLLTEERIKDIVIGMRDVASQTDPIGQIVSKRQLSSGIELTEIRVPLGVIAMVYEARPNVTADAICLCLRSANTCVLRPGSAAIESSKAIADACKEGIRRVGLPKDCIQLISSSNRSQTIELMQAEGLIDVLIPRGGHSLIQTCIREASVPVIQTGEGNCHVYVEASANQEIALSIIKNAKTQRPGVCNAIETVLIDTAIAESFIPVLLRSCSDWGVVVHGCELTCSIASKLAISELQCIQATKDDWAKEYGSLDVALRVVEDTSRAIEHINTFTTHHSECIISENEISIQAFLNQVDAAAVYVNASTRFTDGAMFGLGAEIGISTQKLHIRGPMGAAALTTTKNILRGTGQVRL